MKLQRIASFLFFWAICVCPLQVLSQSIIPNENSITLVSYNIRYANPGDSSNSWENRKLALVDQVKSYHPDFVNIQEGLIQQIWDMDSLLGENWSWIGVGRDDGKNKGEFSAIFYRSDRFDNLYQQTKWLSPTPSIPSKGWDAALPRVVTYGRFKPRNSDKAFWIFNTHFDHVGTIARNESMKLIHAIILEATVNSENTLLTGDFNSNPSSEPIQWMSSRMKDCHLSCSGIQAQNDFRGTFNGFSKVVSTGNRIDYIFTSHNLKCLNYFIDYRLRGLQLYYSDHYPVIAQFQY